MHCMEKINYTLSARSSMARLILVVFFNILYSGAVQSLHEDFVRSSADATRGCLSETDGADRTAETSDSAGRS